MATISEGGPYPSPPILQAEQVETGPDKKDTSLIISFKTILLRLPCTLVYRTLTTLKIKLP